MGFFDKLKAGLQKTQSRLVHEINRIITRSPRLDAGTLDELEVALIGADFRGQRIEPQFGLGQPGSRIEPRERREILLRDARGARDEPRQHHEQAKDPAAP